jgi:hypothetical protein
MDLPPFRTRIVNFFRTFVAHVGNDMRIVPQEKLEERLSICETNACGHFTGTHCAQCGCPANSESVFFNKVAWESSKCPDGRW